MADRPPPVAAAPPRRLLRPRVVFSVLLAVVVLTTLFAPSIGRTGDERLSSFSTEPQGAAALYQTAARLGWRPSRLTTPYAAVLDTTVVYLVLDPPQPVTASESHRLLDAVRRGAGLLVVLARPGPMSDSLKLGRSSQGGREIIRPVPGERACGDSNEVRGIDWGGLDVHSWWLTPRGPLPRDTVSFAWVTRVNVASDSVLPMPADSTKRRLRRSVEVAALGFPYGKGRIVAVADPDWLRNDVIRVCKWRAGETVVRMLTYLSTRDRQRIVFDEFHQGFGETQGTAGAIGWALAGTPPGRTLMMALIAGLVLIAAVGPRPIAPKARERIERRSPLEHVEALARAYEQVGASRVVTRRLVRGIRRRHAPGVAQRASDDDFLRALADRHPGIRGEIALVQRASARPLPPDQLPALARALELIERASSPT